MTHPVFIHFHATEMWQCLNLTVLELHLYCMHKAISLTHPALRQSDVCLRAQFIVGLSSD